MKVGEPKQVAKNHVSVETHNEWKTPDGVKILDEVRVIHFIETPEGRLFAFEITLKATVCPIAFGDTKEGSFGIRTHDSLRPLLKDGATITTADGKAFDPRREEVATTCRSGATRPSGSTTRGRWTSKAVGVAVFDHPINPQGELARPRLRAATRPTRSAANAADSRRRRGRPELLKIEKGGELKLKYAVYAHTGDVKSGKVAEAYEEFKK